MDDRNQPDTNVVRLRRKGDPSEAEREQLASTIFAEPDEVGTFSRGNLVPPSAAGQPGSDEPEPTADPFFESLQSDPPQDPGRASTLTSESDSTAAYFDRLGSQ